MQVSTSGFHPTTPPIFPWSSSRYSLSCFSKGLPAHTPAYCESRIQSCWLRRRIWVLGKQTNSDPIFEHHGTPHLPPLHKACQPLASQLCLCASHLPIWGGLYPTPQPFLNINAKMSTSWSPSSPRATSICQACHKDILNFLRTECASSRHFL